MNARECLYALAGWVGRFLPTSDCALDTGMAGRRQKDFSRHANFWWCFFWSITFPMTGLVFAALAALWLGAILMIYGALLPLTLLSVLFLWSAHLLQWLKSGRHGPSEQCDETGP